jgi:hypothetical protein
LQLIKGPKRSCSRNPNNRTVKLCIHRGIILPVTDVLEIWSSSVSKSVEALKKPEQLPLSISRQVNYRAVRPNNFRRTALNGRGTSSADCARRVSAEGPSIPCIAKAINTIYSVCAIWICEDVCSGRRAWVVAGGLGGENGIRRSVWMKISC